ncbi:DUF3307 domain-containing protein [Neorhizobium alkalisoli]|uniref:Uncharacterized protein DUF3307 n=1 Tax=Neorhizobium alkalisoli TaxID=528178 RepID=A0A561R1F4_9HYPH|nr:DUF3307 domain-containing protein [Neorhizobium alkalisoli]TWF56446.1 uncharacterized protein DUF3307 [Neorhizobium alkalisoli]
MLFNLQFVHDLFALIILLCGAHWLGDYAFQSGYLAGAKTSGPLRIYHLIAHAGIHGMLIFLVTQSVVLGFAEWVLHAIIDDCKVRGWTTYAQDQALHFVCKFIWLIAAFLVVGPPSFLQW